jgi:hypothetical protein
VSELTNKQYEYYNFNLNGQSLQKEVLNKDLQASAGYGLTSLVILNASDLHDTSFACYVDMSGQTFPLMYLYDEIKKTLTVFTD